MLALAAGEVSCNGQCEKMLATTAEETAGTEWTGRNKVGA